MKQKNGAPIPIERQVAILYAASHKFFADVLVAKVTAVEAELVEYLDGQHPKTLAAIKKTGTVSEDLKKDLNRALEEFTLAHKELFSQ